MPDGSAPVADERRYIWLSLAPRLIDPIRLAILEALLRLEQPLSIGDLAAVIDISQELAHYHCKVLLEVDVLEIAGVRPRSDGDGEGFLFDFPPPPQASSPPPSATAA